MCAGVTDGAMKDVAEIAEVVQDLGISGDDIVLVHSALSGMDCSPEVLLDGLRQAVGQGTIVVPTFNFDATDANSVRQFDIEETPSNMGYLTELVRQHPNAQRSIHPTHSFAALGEHAETFARMYGCNAFARDYVLGALHEENAAILSIGLEPFGKAMTFFHLVEQCEGISRHGWDYRYLRTFDSEITIHEKTFRDTYQQSVPTCESYDFTRIGRGLQERELVGHRHTHGKSFDMVRTGEIYEPIREMICEHPDEIYSRENT